MLSVCSATAAKKRWPYAERYLGDLDELGRRRREHGENVWSSPEFIHSYCGPFVRGAMHGEGEYRWRHAPPPAPAASAPATSAPATSATSATYEGRFYANRLDGYGQASYSDGTVFLGLYCNNARFGPGVQTSAALRADVGLWRGRRLARLAWRPHGAPGLAPAQDAPLAPHRAKLRGRSVQVDEERTAAELMTQCGAEAAAARGRELYSDCTHYASAFFDRALFDRAAFGERYRCLEVAEVTEDDIENVKDGVYPIFNAWNNSEDAIEMMRHAYKHARAANVGVSDILNGRRQVFRGAGKHELDCRTALLCCYLGDTLAVAELVNDSDVDPDISDSKGNSALMYACSADQHETIAFLLSAGACVDRANDACLTPLAACLLRYVAAARDASPNQLPALFWPTGYVPTNIDGICSDWMISRGNTPPQVAVGLKQKSKTQSLRKLKSSSVIKVDKHKNSPGKHSAAALQSLHESDEDKTEADETTEREKYNYSKALHEFKMNQPDTSGPDSGNAQYIFQVDDILKDLDIKGMSLLEKTTTKSVTLLPKPSTKLTVVAKSKTANRRSKDTIKQNRGGEEESSVTSSVQIKNQKLAAIEATLLQLAAGGAAAARARCPLPPLAVAMFAGSGDVVRHVLACGADVEEAFPQLLDYKPLDIVLSRPLSPDTLVLARTLLDCGADVAHRLRMPGQCAEETEDSLGPTLLHVVLDKSVESEAVAEIQRTLISLLLEHGADATALFLGRSALDYAMLRDLGLLETFTRHGLVDPNASINVHGQSVLVKVFSVAYFKKVAQLDRLSALANLLTRGADPLLPCRDANDEYRNLFEFAQKQLAELVTPPVQKSPPSKKGAPEGKAKKVTKEAEKRTEEPERSPAVVEYERALEAAAGAARAQHARWLRAKLLADVFGVVERYKHRPWPTILREHGGERAATRWLRPAEALAALEDLARSNKPKFLDEALVRKVMCIVVYYQRVPYSEKLSLKEMEATERAVKSMLNERKTTTDNCLLHSSPPHGIFTSQYKRLERASKYEICLECSLPLPEAPIECIYCNVVSFCSAKCIDANIVRPDSHPCSVLMSRPDTATSENNEQTQ